MDSREPRSRLRWHYFCLSLPLPKKPCRGWRALATGDLVFSVVRPVIGRATGHRKEGPGAVGHRRQCQCVVCKLGTPCVPLKTFLPTLPGFSTHIWVEPKGRAKRNSVCAPGASWDIREAGGCITQHRSICDGGGGLSAEPPP